MTVKNVWRPLLLTAACSVVLLGTPFAPGVERSAAEAAECPTSPCLRVDAIPGGGIDEAASVGSGFSVDVVLQGSAGDIQAFNFALAYNPQVLGASPPSATGLPSSSLNCSLSPPYGSIDQSDGGADADPSTQEAGMTCFSDGSAQIGDGPIAHIEFAGVRAGTSQLRLVGVSVADANGIGRVICEFNGTSAGACTDASVSTSGGGAPPPPPPSGDQCAVAYAIDGETVQCVDGSRVRFIGVASPLGGDAGAGWATALTQWFMAGKTLTLEQDVTPFDEFGSRFGYPHVIGTDGNDYNISALLIYVGMARHLSDGVNVRNTAWFDAAQVWARTACWNMWAAGNPFGAESRC